MSSVPRGPPHYHLGRPSRPTPSTNSKLRSASLSLHSIVIMVRCDFCARNGLECSIVSSRRACSACRRGHRRCLLSEGMPRAPNQSGSCPRPRKRACPDPFVVLDDDAISEDSWTPPGSPPRRPRPNSDRDSSSPLRRAGPPRKDDYPDFAAYRRALRFWADRVRVTQGARDPRIDEILRRRATPAPAPPPPPAPAPPTPRGPTPPPAAPTPPTPRGPTPPPASPVVILSLPPIGLDPPVGSPERPSAPAPPPTDSPEIPEIPVVMALPAASFEVFAERSTTMLRQ